MTVSRFDHFPGDIGAAEELYPAGVVCFSNEGAQFEKAGFQSRTCARCARTCSVYLGWGPSSKVSATDLGGKLGAEDFVAAVAAAHAAGGLLGCEVAKLAENRFPGILLAETGDVGVPLLARARTAARGELRKDASHFLAVGQLNGLQVVEQRPQVASPAFGKLRYQVQECQLVGIVQRAVFGEVADQLPDARGARRRLRECGGDLVEGALFAPEERLARQVATGVGGFVESIGAVHEDDDLAIVIDDA